MLMPLSPFLAREYSWREKQQPKRDPKAAANYGVGGFRIIRDFTLYPFWFSVPTVLGYYVFSGINPRMACLMQHNVFGFPLVSALFLLVIFAMLTMSALRVHGPCRQIIQRIDVGVHDRVLVLQAKRGLYAVELAKKATVVAVDQWGSKYTPGSTDWIIENAARENVPEERLILEPAELSSARLPFPDNHFSAVYVTYPSQLSYLISNSFHPGASRILDFKVRVLMSEFTRVLAPGGRLYATIFEWESESWHSMCWHAGLDGYTLTPGRIWLTWFPSRVAVAVAPGAPGQQQVDPTLLLSDENPRHKHRRRMETKVRVYDPDMEERVATETRLLRILLLLPLLLVYLLLLVLTSVFYTSLEVPPQVPFSNQLAALCVANINLFPLTIWFQAMQMDAFVRDRYRSHDLRRMLTRYGMGVVGKLVLAVTVFDLVVWLPSFLIDLALYRFASSLTVSLINLAYYASLGYLVRRAYISWTAPKPEPRVNRSPSYVPLDVARRARMSDQIDQPLLSEPMQRLSMSAGMHSPIIAQPPRRSSASVAGGDEEPGADGRVSERKDSDTLASKDAAGAAEDEARSIPAIVVASEADDVVH